MPNPHLPIVVGSGTRLQSGIPSYTEDEEPGRARGLMLTGVVTATYVVDDTSHFQNDLAPEGALGVYCDVLCYTNVAGMRSRFIPRCVVLQDRGGMHDGKVWKPRAAAMDVTGSSMDLGRGTNVANLDGDHVLVGFLNDHLNEPIILGGVHHPSADLGAEESSERTRLQLRVVDGDCEFQKHHGTAYGVADNGDYRVDTRFANAGKYDNDGKEPAPPTDGSGSQAFDLPVDATHKVTLWDMSSPESPAEKMSITVDRGKFQTSFADSGLELVVDDANGKFQVLFADSGLEFLVDNANNEIRLGGSSDSAVTLSGINAELNRLVKGHNALADAVAKHRHPSEMFWMPLIPNPANPLTQWIKSTIEFTTKNNILASASAIEGNAPLDEDAGVGEFVSPLPPDPDNPTRESGLFPGSSVPGDPGSTLVKMES